MASASLPTVRRSEKPGYLRFRGRDRYDSFTMSQTGCNLANGRLVLRGIGTIKVKWSRPIQGTIKTVTVRRDADQWYVCFSDAGWNPFLTILAHKAEEAGVVVVVVNPAGTSQVCSRCGRSVPKELSDRWHICPYEECGLSLQRDHNSARAILHRAGLARAVAYVPAAESPYLCTSGHGECQRASQPPSTARTWPWTHAAAGLHRKTTAPATSSGRPQRPAGMRMLICSLRTGSARSGAVWSVAM
jgi:transposase